MKHFFFFLLLFNTLSGISQAQKKPLKKAIVFKPTTVKMPVPVEKKDTVTEKKKDTVVTKVIIPVPEPVIVLTPAEQRKKSALDVLGYMVSTKGLMYSELQEPFELYSKKEAYLEFKPVDDTLAVVLIKNKYNHTTSKLDVTFNDTRLKHIVQYATSIKYPYTDVDNAPFSKEIVFSYFFTYDSTQLKSIGRAYKGAEQYAHQVNRFLVYAPSGKMDSIVYMDHESRRLGVTFYNRKSTPDSVYFYNYNSNAGTSDYNKIYFDSKLLYKTEDSNTRVLETASSNAYGTNTHITSVTLSDSGKLIKIIDGTKDGRSGAMPASINLYSYENPSDLKSSRLFSANLAEAPLDSLQKKANPYTTTYKMNSKGQVEKKVVDYHDACLDSETTTLYLLDTDGFVIESKTTRNNKNKCRY